MSRLSATEIRCQEKSKGGLRYEVILAEPNVTQVQLPKAVQQNAAPKPLSAQEIADKLKAAEERRLVSLLHNPTHHNLHAWCYIINWQNLEAKKISDWTAKMAKIEEISRKKDELNVEFITQTKEALITKMEHSEEKREAIISDLKEKLKVIFPT